MTGARHVPAFDPRHGTVEGHRENHGDDQQQNDAGQLQQAPQQSSGQQKLDDGPRGNIKDESTMLLDHNARWSMRRAEKGLIVYLASSRSTSARARARTLLRSRSVCRASSGIFSACAVTLM
jgi:hypothetical protein